MRKISMRILSFIMAVILAVASGGVSTLAAAVSDNEIIGNTGQSDRTDEDNAGIEEVEENEEDKESESDFENEISLEGEDSFGELLSEAVETEVAAQEENAGYHIFSVEMNGNKGTVSFETLEDAAVVVGVYDETGKKLLASGYKNVSKGETELTVDINADTMPAYFYLKAFLLNPDTLRPLCSVYESPNYTREMQEFFAKSTTDFDADRVLNLDNDTHNNFAVYAEDAVVLEAGTTGTVLEVSDEDEQVYTFVNADDAVKNLQAGDIFVYEYGDGTVLIIKVGGIKKDGDTVVLKGVETSLEEVFEYVKIDESGEGNTVEKDEATYDGSVEYIGTETATLQEEGVLNEEAFVIADGEWEGSIAHTLKIEKEFGDKNKNVKVSGSLKLSLKANLKVYISTGYQYVEFQIKYEAGVAAGVSGNGKMKLPLGFRFGFSLAPGVFVECAPAIVLELSGKVELNGKLSGSVGFSVSNKSGIKNISKAPSFSTNMKTEVTVFVGFSMEPKIEIISDKIAKASLSAEVGVEFVNNFKKTDKKDSKIRHECQKCIDGDIFAKWELSFGVRLLNLEKLKWGLKITNKVKTGDFYYSFDYDELAFFTTCPHLSYQTEFVVLDAKGNAIKDAVIEIGGNSYKTDAKGSVSIWLAEGIHEVRAGKDGYGKKSWRIKVDKGGERIKVLLYAEESSIGSGIENKSGIKSISLSDGYRDGSTAVIMQDGSLYIWGNVGYNDNKSVPVKMMDDVEFIDSASLLWIIKKDGNLYKKEIYYDWLEDNYIYSEGEEYVKIMSNVNMFDSELGRTYAAVTKDGSLYTWGDNDYGQLGNGTREDSDVPIKIMDDVEYVSFGSMHTVALTKDGSLYVWGRNDSGQLGTGTTSYVPTKVMDNVKMVSSNFCNTAAVMKDGSLYIWGDNRDGQLGNGNGIGSDVPVKIMDNVEMVSLGYNHTGAVTKDGNLYMWGENSHGQVGMNQNKNVTTPIKVMDDVEMVSLGYNHTGAVTKDGSLYMWGNNECGQLGNGTTTDSSIPVKVNLPILNKRTLEIESAVSPDNTFLGDGNFTNLLPDETYNFYVMKSKTAEEALSHDNLLYIGQGISDAAGSLNIPYEAREKYDGAVSFAVGMTAPDISGATVNVPNLKYNGKEQYAVPTVTYKGVTLTEGIDYILTGSFSAKNVGKYQLEVVGTGMYTGSVAASYSVTGETTTPVIKKKATSVQLDSTVEMIVGDSRRLTASVLPNDAADKTVRWVSDNPSVATVGADGTVTALKPGQAVISATTNDGSNLTAKCTVYVQPDVNDIPDGPSTWQGKTGTEGFVYRLYNVAMGREADESGFNDWNSQLKTRQKTAAEVARGFIFSDEFKNFQYNDVQYVKILYRTMFGREADEGGLNGWVSDLENGMSREYVYRGFAESAEFSNLCNQYGVERGSVSLGAYRDRNAGATGFIARLYTKMLGRGYDEDGLEYWCRKYHTKENTIEEIATIGFLHSQELQNLNLSDEEFVKRMYRTFLNREAEEAGLQDWIGRLERGEETRDSLVYGFTNSREFANLKKEYNLP